VCRVFKIANENRIESSIYYRGIEILLLYPTRRVWVCCRGLRYPHPSSRVEYCYFCGFLWFFFNIDLHRRCMAVVSSWCYAVLYSSRVCLTDIFPPRIFHMLSYSSTQRVRVHSVLILERKTLFCFPLIWVHVKSSWPIYIGIHLCYNGMDNLLQSICFYFVHR